MDTGGVCSTGLREIALSTIRRSLSSTPMIVEKVTLVEKEVALCSGADNFNAAVDKDSTKFIDNYHVSSLLFF